MLSGDLGWVLGAESGVFTRRNPDTVRAHRYRIYFAYSA
jgi:hypothetical protein